MKRFFIILILFAFTGIFKSQYSEQVYKKAFSYVYENPDNAVKLVNQMLKNEKNIDNQIKLYQLLSRVYMSKRDFDKSLDCVLKMKELSKSISNPEQKIKILNSIALQYQNMGLYSRTIESLDEYYKLCQTLPDGKFKTLYTGMNSAVRGLVYKNQDNNELALEKFFIALRYINQVGNYENSIANTSVILYNIGYSYFYLKKYNEAEKYFRQSAHIAKSAHAESLEAFAYKGLSENYTVLGRHQEAIELLKKSVNLSKKVGDLVLSEGIYKGFSDNYLALQDWNNYEVYNKLYIETKFAREQSELASLNKSIDALNLENNQKIEEQHGRLSIILFMIVATSTAVFIGFLTHFIRHKKRNQLLLEKLNQINKITV